MVIVCFSRDSRMSVKFSFEIVSRDSKTYARAGVIKTSRGEIKTPVFMPVGTYGGVRGIMPKDLEKIGFQIILANTYHLYLRPGIDVIAHHGGLHRFSGWNKPILTDSGGFQVFSLSHLRKITEDGVEFRSHLDGSSHFLTPELAMKIQKIFNSDICMALDVCPPSTAERGEIERAMKLTTLWAKRSLKSSLNENQSLFGIVQGGIYLDLRKIHIEEISSFDFEGVAIGGLSVGEEIEKMHEVAYEVGTLLPDGKPRYLMGVGTPEDILVAVRSGFDMFDCVFPTRGARNGLLFTKNGKINIRNAKYKMDLNPLDDNCPCYVCKRFTKSYLRHLSISNEILSSMLNTLHNLTFYEEFMKSIREAILKGIFSEFMNDFIKNFTSRVKNAI